MILWFEDDLAFTLEIEEFAVGNDLNVKIYRDPDDFEAEFTSDMIKDVNLIVMDYDLDGKTILDIKLIEYIKEGLGFKGAICVVSDLGQLPEFKNKFYGSVNHFVNKSSLTDLLEVMS